MTDVSRGQLDRVAAAILRYLAEHPGAADSELGIAEWWLPTLGVEVGAGEVRRALEELQRAGRVEALPLSDGKNLWRATSGGAGDAVS